MGRPLFLTRRASQTTPPRSTARRPDCPTVHSPPPSRTSGALPRDPPALPARAHRGRRCYRERLCCRTPPPCGTSALLRGSPPERLGPSDTSRRCCSLPDCSPHPRLFGTTSLPLRS